MTSDTREPAPSCELRRIAVCVCLSEAVADNRKAILEENESLTERLEAIGSQIVTPEIHPIIIVVDSQSGAERKGNVESFKRHCPYDVVYIREQFASEAAVKNKAIEAALARSVDWVVFLEHNLAIEPDWLINIVYPNYHRVAAAQGEALDIYEGESLCYFLGTERGLPDEVEDGKARTAIYVRYSADILRKGLRFTDGEGRTWADISSVLQGINKASPKAPHHLNDNEPASTGVVAAE